jgi:hypothetical protein
MKRVFKIFAVAAVVFSVAAATGCDADLEFGDENGNGRTMVIDNIEVYEDEWQAARLDDGSFDYYFADKPISELDDDYIFNRATFHTFWRYDEVRDGQRVDVQESLPAVMDLDRFEGDMWIPYTETLSCSYEVGYIRFRLSRSDFNSIRPDGSMLFRMVITY